MAHEMTQNTMLAFLNKRKREEKHAHNQKQKTIKKFEGLTEGKEENLAEKAIVAKVDDCFAAVSKHMTAAGLPELLTYHCSHIQFSASIITL